MSGTVTIDDAGNASGSGSALALYTAIHAIETAANPLPSSTPDDDWEGSLSEWETLVLTQIVKVKRSWARAAQAHADILTDTDTTIGMALLALQSTTLATAVDTLLTFAVLAGEVWHVEFDALLTCGTGGVKLGVNAPAASTVVGQVFGAASSATLFNSAPIAAIATPVGALAVSGASRVARMTATVTVAADGALTVQLASVTAGQTSTIQAGASLRARKLTGV